MYLRTDQFAVMQVFVHVESHEMSDVNKHDPEWALESAAHY